MRPEYPAAGDLPFSLRHRRVVRHGEAMPHALFSPELREMIAEKDADGLRAFCEHLHPATVAEALDEFTAAEVWEAISPADIRTQAAIFEYLPIAKQIEMVEGAARPQVGRLIEQMSHDDRVDLLRRLPARVRDSLLRLVDEADRRDIATLVSHRENTVGALMTTDYAWLPPDLSAAEAIDQLRQQAPDRETIYYVYVLDEPQRRPDGGLTPRKLLGVITLRDLILAPRHSLVRDLMEEETVTLKVTDDREAAADLLARYDLIAVPVVDDDGGMVGIVTHDDILDVVQQEATEDLQRQAAIGLIEGNYLETRFARVWWHRVKWLAALFIAQMFTINAMAQYEKELEAVAALAAFVPLVLSVGGNSGSQAATLVIRALALGQVRVFEWFRVFRRELLMALALAASLGVLAILRTLFLTPTTLAGDHVQLVKLTYVITLAVMAMCMWGALLGSMLPLLIRRLGFDPALISSPAIATISDVSGIVIYFTIATYFFF
jgi:magnesium transporter